MKKSLQRYIIWVTLVMLAILLFFQVRWMVYSVHFQEKIFRNSLNLAMDKTIAALNSDMTVCNLMRECMRCDTTNLDSMMLSRGIWDKIHMLIDVELAYYDIHLDYDLFITADKNAVNPVNPAAERSPRGVYHTQSLREVLQENGYELVVQLKRSTGFISREAALMLSSSVFLILLIFISIIQMVRLYRNELRLVENIKELLNNVTHEFKTPMSSIALASNLIRKGRLTHQPEKLQEYATLIFKENQKLQRQVESLLDLAAIEWGDFEYQKTLVGVNEVAHDAAHTARLLVEEKGGTLNEELQADDDNVCVDRLHLANAIMNLLTNAAKYSKGVPEIVLRTYNQGNEIFLEVEDKGIGIPPKYHRYIFDKYYRVPTGDVHNIKGFGIGLSYVKSVVEAHGGRVFFISEPGIGSTFTVVIPKANVGTETASGKHLHESEC